LKKFIPAVFTIALLAASLPTHADTRADRNGDASDRISSTRVITIGSNTPWVNVSRDEVVTFVSGGQEFSWNFDGVMSKVSLQQIAPAAFNAKDINVYISGSQNIVD
jgi:hypothetical protein